MAIYIKDAARWRKTVAVVGMAMWSAVAVRVVVFGAHITYDVDTVLLTTSVVALAYSARIIKGGTR
jgi:hypothetical protein